MLLYDDYPEKKGNVALLDYRKDIKDGFMILFYNIYFADKFNMVSRP